MLLTGHQGEIYTAKFHPEGNVIASAGFERNICKSKIHVRKKKKKELLKSEIKILDFLQSCGMFMESVKITTLLMQRTQEPFYN